MPQIPRWFLSLVSLFIVYHFLTIQIMRALLMPADYKWLCVWATSDTEYCFSPRPCEASRAAASWAFISIIFIMFRALWEHYFASSQERCCRQKGNNVWLIWPCLHSDNCRHQWCLYCRWSSLYKRVKYTMKGGGLIWPFIKCIFTRHKKMPDHVLYHHEFPLERSRMHALVTRMSASLHFPYSLSLSLFPLSPSPFLPLQSTIKEALHSASSIAMDLPNHL